VHKLELVDKYYQPKTPTGYGTKRINPRKRGNGKEVTYLYYNLILALKRAQLTQKDLALELGISQHTMSKKVKGEVDFWLSEVKAICQILGIADLQTAADLFKKD